MNYSITDIQLAINQNKATTRIDGHNDDDISKHHSGQLADHSDELTDHGTPVN